MTIQTRYTDDEDPTMRQVRRLREQHQAGQLSEKQYTRAYGRLNRRHGRRCARWFCRGVAAITPDKGGRAICAKHYLASQRRQPRTIAYWLSWIPIAIVASIAGAALALIIFLARAIGLI